MLNSNPWLTYNGKKHPPANNFHNLGPPPKRRKHGPKDGFPTIKREPASPLKAPLKREVVEIDSDGEEPNSKKVKDVIPQELNGTLTGSVFIEDEEG